MGLGDSQVALDILLNAVDNTKDGVEGASGRLGKLGDVVGGVAKIATATAGAALAFGGVAIKVFNDTGEAAHEMSSKFGMTTERASSWLAAGKLLGVSNDSLMTGFQMLTRTMNNLDLQFATTGKFSKSQTEVFKELGVQILDAHGKMRPLNDVMLDISAKFASMPDGAEKAGLAMKLFGRSGADLIPFLDQGSKRISDMMLMAKNYGVVVGEDDVQATRYFHMQLAELKLRGEGVLITFARGLMPVMDTFFAFLNGTVMPKLLMFSQWFASEGAPRLQEWAIKIDMVAQDKLPKLVAGAKSLLDKLQPLVQPLKDLASQLVGIVPSLASASNLMSVWGSATSQLPTLLNLIVLALRIASPLIKALGDNANVLAPAIYAIGAAFTVWKAIQIGQLVFGVAGAFTAMAAQEGIATAATTLLGISFGPLTLVLLAIAAVVALVAFAWKNNWGDIQGKTKAAVAFIGEAIRVIGPWVQTYILAPMAAAVGFIRANWDSIKAVIGDALGIISGLFRGDFGGVVKSASDLFQRVANAIVGIFRGIHIPMPHFSFSGSMNPVDWAKGQTPALNVAWYGMGGSFIANSPTLIGVGERGPESVNIRPLGSGGSDAGGVVYRINIYGDVDSDKRVRDLAREFDRQRRLAGGRIVLG